MGKLIRFDDDARQSLRRGVEQLTAAVRVTLGPRGRNVVIDHGSGVPTITGASLHSDLSVSHVKPLHAVPAGQSLSILQPLHLPMPSHTRPGPPHEVLAGAFIVTGMIPLHISTVHGFPSSPVSIGSG